jgi:hypothetical protein
MVSERSGREDPLVGVATSENRDDARWNCGMLYD